MIVRYNEYRYGKTRIGQSTVEDFVRDNLIGEEEHGGIEVRLAALTNLVGRLIERELKKGSMNTVELKDLLSYSTPEIVGLSEDWDYSERDQ